MYHQVPISKLSHTQIVKLLKGQRIRIKPGQGHVLHLSNDQTKKLHSAHKKGKGMTVELDPFQQQIHRCGGIGDIFSNIGRAFTGTVAKQPVGVECQALSTLLNDIAPYGEKATSMIAPPLVPIMRYGVKGLKNQYGVGQGEGFMDVFKSVGKAVAPVLIDLAASEAKKQAGSGVRGAARGGRRGKGFADVFKSVGKAVAPAIIDLAASEAKKQAGSGLPSPEEYWSNIESRFGGALLPAGYGLKKRGKKGEGFMDVFKSVGKAVAPVLIDLAATEAKKQAGSGVRGSRGGKRGRGAIGGVIGQTLGDIFIPF